MKTSVGGIRRTIQKHKTLTIFLMAAMLTACVFSVKALSNGSRAEAATEGLETVEVKKMDLAQSITLSGTVQGGETYSAQSTVAGVKITSVNVKTGDYVREGDVIATLDDSLRKVNAETARKKLSYVQEDGENSVATAERKLENAKEDRDTTAANGEYSVSYAMNNYNKAVTDQQAAQQEYDLYYDDLTAEAESMKAEVEPRIAQLETERQECLDQIGELKEQGKTEADDEIKSLNKEIDTIDSDISKLVSKYTSIETKAKTYKTALKTANNAVDTAYNALVKAQQAANESNTSKQRTVREQKAALEKAEIQAKSSQLSPKQDVAKTSKELEKCTITAPVSGTVTAVKSKAGEIYAGEAVAYIQNNSTLTVSALADQYDINSLEEGMTAEVTVKAAKQKKLSASLIYVADTPVVSGKSGSSKADVSYQVVSSVDNSSMKLKVGMDAKISVKLREKKDVLAVPDECVQTDENGNRYVEVVKSGGSTKKVEVEYGMRTDTYSEISGKGIKEGVRVLVPAKEEESKDSGSSN